MGPLQGVKILEFAGLGPAPFACMLLADMGADVLTIDKPPVDASPIPPRFNLNNRGKRSLIVDLKSPDGVTQCLALTAQADVLVEGFRPGVMERLGLGPEQAMAQNPRLIYGRMTGWGQHGPLASVAGHDINYIGLTGVLHAVGRADHAPTPPMNLVGDFGGGALYLTVGVLGALLHARTHGQGQIVDAAMVDGSASLLTMMQGMLAAGNWTNTRGANLLDSGCPWYDVYETRDGLYMALGALEPRFYANFLQYSGLATSPDLPDRDDPAQWPALRARFAALFKRETQAYWSAEFSGIDACVSPVLAHADALQHPHLMARGTFGCVDDIAQAMPAPRFSATPSAIRHPPPQPGEGGEQALRDWGLIAD